MDPDDPDDPDLLTLVRERCGRVAAAASSVTIDLERLTAYVDTLVEDPSPAPATADPWSVTPEAPTDEAAVALIVSLDAINFGSGYHPHVRKLPGRSGATTMAARLRAWADQQGAIRAEHLAELDAPDVHQIFDQPDTDEMTELMGLFTLALNELGRTVVERHDGSFVALVGSADGSAAALVATLAALSTYADVSIYAGFEVPFLKRAQITVADLHRSFGGVGPGAFADVDRLTAFADNLVPHVLRVDGVLVLDPELDRAIAAGDLLVHGDAPEVELRASAVHAVEVLRDELTARGVERTAAQIDQALWARGGGPRYKALPRPRARTSAY